MTLFFSVQSIFSPRYAALQRVFFIEEPIFEDIEEPFMKVTTSNSGVIVCVPHLKPSLSTEEFETAQKYLTDEVFDISSMWIMNAYV